MYYVAGTIEVTGDMTELSNTRKHTVTGLTFQ